MIKSKIAIYCRRSNNNFDNNSQSIETQKIEGIKFANEEKNEYEFFIDEGISGTVGNIEDRPAFAEMLNDIRLKKFDKVFCVDQSRIERNNEIWNLFTSILIQNKCKYYPSGIHLDLEDATNIFISGVLSQANQLFAKLTSKKVKLANKLNAEKGKTHGITAYGYKRGDDGKFNINEEESIIVKRIFDLSLKGKGAYTIANILNSENIPTKFNNYKGEIKRKDKYTGNETRYKKSDVKWRGNVILDMIKNPIYKGIYSWNKNEINLDVNIIDATKWDAVNDNLKKNKKNVGRRDEYNYLLNGLVFCSDCGKEYRGKKRLKGRDNAYKCTGKRYPNSDCNNRGVSIPKLENFIIKHLFESKQLKEILTTIPNVENEKNVLVEKLNSKKLELNQLEKEINNATKLLVTDGFEDDSTLIDFVRNNKVRMANIKKTLLFLKTQFRKGQKILGKKE